MKRCLQCDHLHEGADEDPRCPACGDVPVQIAGFDCYAPDWAHSAPGYDPRHYAELHRLEAGNFWFRARNALILDAMAEHSRIDGSYLEIGCGTGFVLGAVSAAFPALACSGSEVFVEGLGFAASRAARARLFQMDASRIPFVSHFDTIAAFDVLEHIEDDEAVMASIHEALRESGRLLVTVPQHPWLWSLQDEAAHHVRRYRRGELEEKLRRNGFRVLSSTSFVSLLLPVMLASRVAQRGHRDGGSHDPYAEFRIPRWLDASFAGIMHVERLLIRAGLSFPMGGSRLVVAERMPE